MNVNATLLGQMITFALFVAFTMRYVWPLLSKVLEERQQNIADGLAAADEGRKALQDAHLEVREKLQGARERSLEMIAQANKQAILILEDARQKAHQEHDQIVAAGRLQIEKEVRHAKEELRSEVVGIAVQMVEKLLNRQVTESDQEHLLKSMQDKRMN